MNNFKRYYFILFIIGVIAAWIFVLKLPSDENLLVHLLDVGQGDAIFIETPERNQILIDGGPDISVLGELSSVMPFYDRSIDLVVLTHPQEDHIFGLVEVLRRYDVASVLLTGVNYKSKTYDEFINIVKEKNIDSYVAQAGQKIKFSDVVFDVLYPFNNLLGSDFAGDANDTSVALRLQYKEKSFLFMGDAEVQEELALINSGHDIDVDVLKLNHHGSKTSTTQLFLEKTTPEIALASVGINNRFGHPHQEVLDRLKEISLLRTDQNGRITVITDGINLKVESER